MKESIFTILRENKYVEDWLKNKTLANGLRQAAKDAAVRVETESRSKMELDNSLMPYASELLSVNNDLQQIGGLRDEESRLLSSIQAEENNLAKAKHTRKTLITLAVIAVVVIACVIAGLTLTKKSAPVEEPVVENVQE